MENLVVNFIGPLLQAVIAVAVPFLVRAAVSYLSKKTGVAVAEETRNKLDALAVKAVLTVEEKALSDLKGKAEKWPAYAKRKEAIDRVLSHAPALSQEQAAFLVDWAVAHLPGVGASGTIQGGGNAGASGATATAT